MNSNTTPIVSINLYYNKPGLITKAPISNNGLINESSCLGEVSERHVVVTVKIVFLGFSNGGEVWKYTEQGFKSICLEAVLALSFIVEFSDGLSHTSTLSPIYWPTAHMSPNL